MKAVPMAASVAALLGLMLWQAPQASADRQVRKGASAATLAMDLWGQRSQARTRDVNARRSGDYRNNPGYGRNSSARQRGNYFNSQGRGYNDRDMWNNLGQSQRRMREQR